MATKKKDDTQSEDIKVIQAAFDKVDEYQDEWTENERYYECEYDPERQRKLEKALRSNIFIPVSQSLVDIAHSIFTTSFLSNGCPIDIQPHGQFDREVTNEVVQIIKYEYDRAKATRDELGKAMLTGLIFPICSVTSYWDTRKKRMVTANMPITDIAFDYEANNINDQEYICYKLSESNATIVSKIESGFYNLGKKGKGNNKRFIAELLGENYKQHKRQKIEEIHRRTDKGWEVKSYCKKKLLRVVSFERLQFQFGYAIRQLPKINEDDRKDQVLAYGAAFIRKLMPLNDEMNLKRNQKNDLQEENLNPSLYVFEDATVKSSDLKKGPGKRINVKGKKDSIQQVQGTSEYSLTEDVAILNKDLEDASGINGVQRGQTSASDRRSAAAIATVNANSSPRTEEMIQMMADSLFLYWAKNFVHQVIKNIDDDKVKLITGKDEPLIGRKGKRDLDFNIKINFGASINKQAMIQDVSNLMQMIGQVPGINPKLIEHMIKELLTMILGESVKLDEVFGEAGGTTEETPPEPTPEEVGAV